MDVSITQVLLPLVLAFIMFSLGLGLKTTDFTNISKNPKSFGIGFINQLLLLSIVTFVLIKLFNINNEMAFGMMLLSFCPGGATSNMLAHFMKGNVALSISLTAVMSLMTIITVPIFIGLAYGHFIGNTAEPINIIAIGIKMCLIAVIPVVLGMTVLRLAPSFTEKAYKPISIIASVLFVVIVIGAIAKHKQVLISQFSVLGPMIIVLIITLLGLGLLISRVLGLSWFDAKTVALETGIQNGTMGIVLAGIILTSTDALPVYAIPSAIYSVLMYVVCAPFIVMMRNR